MDPSLVSRTNRGFLTNAICGEPMCGVESCTDMYVHVHTNYKFYFFSVIYQPLGCLPTDMLTVSLCHYP